MKLSNNHIFTTFYMLHRIQIIAILASLLLPALGKARAMARSSLCTGNLRQFGLAANMYGDEYSDYLLPQQTVATNGTSFYYTPVNYWTGYLQTTILPNCTEQSWKQAKTINRCPDRSDETSIAASGYAEAAYSYAHNSLALGDVHGASPKPRKRGKLKRPSFYIAFVDSEYWAVAADSNLPKGRWKRLKRKVAGMKRCHRPESGPIMCAKAGWKATVPCSFRFSSSTTLCCLP